MIIPRLPLSCWPVVTDLANRFGKFKAFLSTGPKAATSVGLDIMHDLPVLVVERTRIERDFTEVDAPGRFLEIHATDATLSRLRYPSTVVNGLLRIQSVNVARTHQFPTMRVRYSAANS